MTAPRTSAFHPLKTFSSGFLLIAVRCDEDYRDMMHAKLAALLALTILGCSETLPPVPPGDRAAFRTALSNVRADMASLRACIETGQSPSNAVRAVEVREARLSFLERYAARHRLASDVDQVQREGSTLVAFCKLGFDHLRERFDDNAALTLEVIERVESLYRPGGGLN